MTNLALSSTSDVITLDQNWHHPYATSSEKLRAKFNATAHGYSIAKIARLDDALLEVFYLRASPVEGQSLQQKEKKRRKRKGKKEFKNRKA